jgi:hypothetical protein
MRSWPVRLLVSVTLAGVLARLVFAALPDELDVRTDIVGYPTFANFSIDRYFWTYGLAVVFFPLATLAIFLLLTRAFLGSLGPWGPIPRPLERVETVHVATGWQEWVVALGRTVFVGGVLGIEAAVVVRPAEPLELVAVFAVAYASLVGLGAVLTSLVARRNPVELVGVVNILAAPVTVAALYGVSESTQVTVTATGVVHDYPWLPVWLAFGTSAVLFLLLGSRLARSATHAQRNALERTAILLIVAPVALFLFVASLPGGLGTLHLFEEGQVLAGSELTREGAFPWRDLLMAHGLLHDVGGGLLGSAVFEDSRWGVVAGGALLLGPLYWVALYYLCTYLFEANWLFLLGTQLLVITGHIFFAHIRFALLPLALLLLAALLRRPTVRHAVAFTSLLFVQVIVTPEAFAAAAAYVGSLAVFELYYYERGHGLADGFRRTWLCLCTGAFLTLGWSLFLLANGALDDWVYSFTTLIPGHRLTGGIPSVVLKTEFEVVAPVVLVLTASAFFVACTRLRRSLALQDWIMLATAALTALYYTKFLGHADHDHLYQSFSVAVPLLFYAAYRGVTCAEAMFARFARARGAAWFPARHTVTLPLLVMLLATAPVALNDAARAAPIHFAVGAPREPEIERIGFDRPGENDATMIRDVSRVLASLLGPGETVFDFSNAPGLFHYLLDVPPGTRYYHVSLAIRQRTQTDLVQLLGERRPEVVVFTSDGDGHSAPNWDGIANQVRHYDVSQYLLDNYVPVLDSHGFVLMRRRENGVRADRELYFHVYACDWGYVPSFFSLAPEPSADALPLSFRPLGSSSGRRWAVDLPENGSANGYRWLELRTGEPLQEGRFGLVDRRGTSPDSTRSIAFNTPPRGERTVRVRVGSCSQWRGYQPGTLYLTSTVAQDVREVRLLR